MASADLFRLLLKNLKSLQRPHQLKLRMNLLNNSFIRRFVPLEFFQAFEFDVSSRLKEVFRRNEYNSENISKAIQFIREIRGVDTCWKTDVLDTLDDFTGSVDPKVASKSGEKYVFTDDESLLRFLESSVPILPKLSNVPFVNSTKQLKEVRPVSFLKQISILSRVKSSLIKYVNDELVSPTWRIEEIYKRLTYLMKYKTFLPYESHYLQSLISLLCYSSIYGGLSKKLYTQATHLDLAFKLVEHVQVLEYDVLCSLVLACGLQKDFPRIFTLFRYLSDKPKEVDVKSTEAIIRHRREYHQRITTQVGSQVKAFFKFFDSAYSATIHSEKVEKLYSMVLTLCSAGSGLRQRPFETAYDLVKMLNEMGVLSHNHLSYAFRALRARSTSTVDLERLGQLLNLVVVIAVSCRLLPEKVSTSDDLTTLDGSSSILSMYKELQVTLLLLSHVCSVQNVMIPESIQSLRIAFPVIEGITLTSFDALIVTEKLDFEESSMGSYENTEELKLTEQLDLPDDTEIGLSDPIYDDIYDSNMESDEDDDFDSDYPND